VLYLSGHGFNLHGRYEFITYDVARPTFAEIAEHGLSQDALQDLLAAIPAGRAILVLDTCYAGGATALGDRNMLIRSADRRIARATGRSVLAAATGTQEAVEGYHDHGVLTYVLLEGLSGSAAPAATAITARELGNYVVRRVPAISEQVFKTRQLPVFTLVGEDIVLAQSPFSR
jgi:helicase